MRLRNRERALQLENGLLAFDREKRALPGIRDPQRRAVLVEQLVESVRRVNYVAVIQERELSERRADPCQKLFDPLKAAVIQKRCGNDEEAFWLVFLSVHFGKHSVAGWRYASEVYGRLGDGARWDWTETSGPPC